MRYKVLLYKTHIEMHINDIGIDVCNFYVEMC